MSDEKLITKHEAASMARSEWIMERMIAACEPNPLVRMSLRIQASVRFTSKMCEIFCSSESTDGQMLEVRVQK